MDNELATPNGLATTDNLPLQVDQINQLRLEDAEDLLFKALNYYWANCMYIPEDHERPKFPMKEIEEFLGVEWAYSGWRRV